MTPEQTMESSEQVVATAERYERGLALKNAGLYKSAIEQFEQATSDPELALKAYAHIGLCFKLTGRYENAVAAFRKALTASTGSSKETVQILYVLGRTLESLGRIAETLEAYRWIRREDPGYRDVADRIALLSSRRSASTSQMSPPADTYWISDVLRFWQDRLRTSK